MQCKKTHTLKNWYKTIVTYFSKQNYKLSPYHIKQEESQYDPKSYTFIKK